MIWSGDDAVWSRKNGSTSKTGGGGFLLATACAYLAASAIMWVCDLAAWGLRSARGDGERSQLAMSGVKSGGVKSGGVKTSSRDTRGGELCELALDDSRAVVAEDANGAGKGAAGRGSRPGGGQEVGGVALRIVESERADGDAGGVAGGSMVVPLAGWRRPDMRVLLRRAPPRTRVAAGGPPSMLRGLATALSDEGMAPYVCLTHSM